MFDAAMTPIDLLSMTLNDRQFEGFRAYASANNRTVLQQVIFSVTASASPHMPDYHRWVNEMYATYRGEQMTRSLDDFTDWLLRKYPER